MTVFTVTPIIAAVNVVLMIVLALRVVHFRMENQVSLGANGIETLERAIRAHGNLTEYVPFALILLALLEWNGLPAWQLAVLGGAFTLARVSHAVGMIRNAATARAQGALWSVIALLGMAGLAVIQAVL